MFGVVAFGLFTGTGFANAWWSRVRRRIYASDAHPPSIVIENEKEACSVPM